MSQTATLTRDEAPAASAAEARTLATVLAEFETPDQLLAAAQKVRDAGFTKWDTHSPYPVHGIDAAMGTRPTKLPIVIFIFGLAGASIGAGLQLLANGVWYPLVISGKPLFSLPANIPIMFELTILLASISAVFGMLIFNGLPALYNALFTSARFARVTRDRFFVTIDAADPKFDASRTPAFLQSLGAAHVEAVYDSGPVNPPKAFFTAGVILALIGLIPLAIIWKARVGKSTEPRIHIVQDMDNQERFKAQQPSALFRDGRAMRLPVAGSVARGELRSDPHFYEGLAGGSFATTFPPQVKVTRELIEHGQQRFIIYCAPCHGLDGAGKGPVAMRADELAEPAWVAPLNLSSDEVRARPVGHIFGTITRGIRSMPAYGDQIGEADRWAIVAYVRALQRSQHATLEDAPAEQRARLEP